MARILVSMAAVFALTSTTAVGRSRGPCLAGRQQALIADGFSGPTDCERFGTTFTLIGRTSPRNYAIYDYRYRYMPESGSVMHGGQRIVIFRGTHYVGQYALSPPPYLNAAVQGSRFLLAAPHTGKRWVMNFSEELPPSIFANGEIEKLFK